MPREPQEMSETSKVVCPHCHTPNVVPDTRLGEGPRCGKCKQALFESHPVELDEASFERHVANSDIPLLVDFWAPWCGPCRAMAPAFADAAGQLEPRVRLAKINTDAAPTVGAQYAIRSIPTMILFKGGREIARHSGALRAGDIVRWAHANGA